MRKKGTVEELTEDIEVVGPGQMLADARKEMGLTQEQVAEKLNFRNSLVRDIEQEIFDKALPSTFNRGYLKNYAKLVNASIDEVLASYEMLNIAQKQGAEMQSFSKQTEKQAESNLIMWISYFILILLIVSTVIWWYQESKFESASSMNEEKNTSLATNLSSENTESQVGVESSRDETVVTDSLIADEQTVTLSETLKASPTMTEVTPESIPSETVSEAIATSDIETISPQVSTTIDESLPQSVEFTFSGDCWVNIYDATGERIAWGIKKAGYVMTISGQAPFTITLGKPELVSIVYQEQTVDMSQFNRGNVAKFNLPLE